jgi:hypothetical protein
MNVHAEYAGEVAIDDGTGASTPFVQFIVNVPRSDFDAALAAYEPESPTSPGVAHCRPPERAMLDSYLAANPT